jgi:hypothetical protein
LISPSWSRSNSSIMAWLEQEKSVSNNERTNR